MIETARSAFEARRRSWLLWIVASTVGWVLGGALGGALTDSGGGSSGALVVAGGAIAAGVGQWLVLRGEIDHAVRWILATIAAVPVVAGPVMVIDLLDWGSAVAIGGLALGTTQWLVLRRHARRAGWWVVASTVGWIVGGLMSGATSPPAGWAVIGATYGIVTGTVLVVLLGDPDEDRGDGRRGA